VVYLTYRTITYFVNAGFKILADRRILEIHRQVLKGRLRGQRADASTGHAEAFAADSCSDLLVFLLDMNNAPFVIDSVFISLSLIKGAYQSETGVIL